MAPKAYEYFNMLKMSKLNKTDTILDLGCGEGTLTLSKSVKKAIGIDANQEVIADAIILMGFF